MQRTRQAKNRPVRLRRLPLAAAICLAASTSAFAQDASGTQDPATPADTAAQTPPATPPAPAATPPEARSATLETITVTAQKRAENVQKVPISMQVLSTEKLEQLDVKDFDDYVKYLPSVSYQSFGPGFSYVYMRGVASGGDGNHSGSLPSVGMYLDEEPITTIQGALDIHIYDIARVESLSGPQGTLYGASSEAGTIRIITNKPDPGVFAAGYGVEANAIDGGGTGWVTEAFVNAPLSESAAIRLVGWDKKDAGYIDNVSRPRTFPSSGITVDNTDRLEDDYNSVYTTGARAALKIDINDSWSVMPTLMGQHQVANGSFAFDESVGDLQLSHRFPDTSDDLWTQAGLTVLGKIGNFDVTYAFSHLKRNVDTESDYADYSYWYDVLYGYGAYICDIYDPVAGECAPGGSLIDPTQYIVGKDQYTKRSNELRIASPSDQRLRFVAGLFWQQQNHDIQQQYKINGLSPQQSVAGWPDTIWLTKQVRRDHDEAIFGELSFDFTDKLTGTIGGRHFRTENSLEGFFGFGDWGWVSSYGQAICPEGAPTFHGAPCETFNKTTSETGTLGRANLTYEFDDERMVYATWSEGFRPGGINRRGTLPPYQADYLTNYELGFKTAWFDHRLVLNGAVFDEKWRDFQFSILGANGLTEIKNAAQAEIRGAEMDFNWAATYNLRVNGGIAWYDPKLTENYCGFTDLDGNPITDCPPGTINPSTGDPVDGPEAPDGSRLPVTAKLKGNLGARYTFDLAGGEAYLAGVGVYEGERPSDLRVVENAIIGNLDSYWLLDLSAGYAKDNWAIDLFLNNATDERAQEYRFAQCAEAVCGQEKYLYTAQPRTVGIRFSQKF